MNLRKSLYYILILSLMGACKDQARLTQIDNEAKLEEENRDGLKEESNQLVVLSDWLHTANGMIESFDTTSESHILEGSLDFFQERNEALRSDIRQVAEELKLNVLDSPSEKMIPTIEELRALEMEQEKLKKFLMWMNEYATSLDEIAGWMMQSSDNKSIITLGSSVNSYSYALKREINRLKETK